MLKSSNKIEYYRKKYLANKNNPLKTSKKSMMTSFISDVKGFDKNGKQMDLSQFSSTVNKAKYENEVEKTKNRMIDEEVINYICDLFYKDEIKGSIVSRSKKDFKKTIKEVIDYIISLESRNIKNNVIKNTIKIPKFKINKNIHDKLIDITKERLVELELIDYRRTFIEKSIKNIIEKISNDYYFKEIKGKVFKMKREDFNKEIKSMVHYKILLLLNPQLTYVRTFKIDKKIANNILNSIEEECNNIDLIKIIKNEPKVDETPKLNTTALMGQMSKLSNQSALMGQISKLGNQSALMGQMSKLGNQSALMGSMGQMGQMTNQSALMGQMGQMGQMSKLGNQSALMGSMGQMGQMGQMTNQSALMGQMGQMSKLGNQSALMGSMGQMGQMTNQSALMGQMGSIGQTSEMPEGIDQIKDLMKIFDIFKPENINNIIYKLRMINSAKFDAVEELKDLDKKKKFELVKLKYVAKFVNSLEEKDINKFIKSLTSSLPIPKVEGNEQPNALNSMGLGNSINIDLYTIKDITSIFMDINDEMYNLIQDLVNDQIKLVKKAQKQGIMTEGIDVRLIPKLLNILDQLSMANLDKIINLATTKFGVVIPVRGFQIKLLVKSLKIVFPLKNQAKLTNNIKDEMRTFVIFNDLSNENKGAVNQFKHKLKEKEVINKLSTPLLKNNQISENIKNNKSLCLLLILLINSFYLTHNIKLFDIEKIKNIYGAQRKITPNITLEDIKKNLKTQIILIYKRFIYTKGFILLLSKYALDYYSIPKYNHRFYNILFHIVYSLNQSNNALNIYHYEFDYQLYLKNIQNETFKKSIQSYDLESNVENIYKIILNNPSLKLNEVMNTIYENVFKNKDYKSMILESNTFNSSSFTNFFNKIIKKKYVAYVSDENVSTLRFNKSINITKPVYFSLHELSLSDYNRVNKFILRANLDLVNEKRENENNENNENNNQARVKYTKEELNELTKLIKKKMYNNSELNKLIRNKDNSIYNSLELINKMKDLYKFEAFILLIFKSYYTNIFNLLTQYLVPLAKEALTKV